MQLMQKMGLTMLCAWYCGCVSADNNSAEVQHFKTTWVAQALKLQRAIDMNLPLNQATFLGTHNSENAISYQIPFIRYLDPNQILSVYDQLEMGVRSIEYDVHWYMGRHFKRDILLSHALSNHVGCSAFDRPVVEGFTELRSWLEKNPDEVVILYFDRGTALDGHEPRLTSYLQEYLGDYIYKPTALQHQTLSTCISLPGSISKADILRAGKQLVIITKDCDGSNPHYQEQDQYHLNWNDYVFAGIGDVKNHHYTIMDSSIGDDFTPYPDCSQSTVFHDDPDHTVPWRIFEDRTNISKIISHPRQLLAADIQTMVNCGINWQTMDMLSANDDRLAAAIWSWAPNYPIAGQGNCAMYQAGEGVKNIACSTTLSAYACQNAQSLQFKIVKHAGAWQDGESVCQQEVGMDWHFVMPMNGKQMYLLKQAVSILGQNEVWLNYHETTPEVWQAK